MGSIPDGYFVSEPYVGHRFLLTMLQEFAEFLFGRAVDPNSTYSGAVFTRFPSVAKRPPSMVQTAGVIIYDVLRCDGRRMARVSF